MAYHDPLTRLPNRMYFAKQLGDAIGHAHRRADRLCVYYIDLVGFKSVNDTLGHAAGDETLCIVAARLRAAVRGQDVVARIGGDEFVALAYVTGGDDGALDLGRRFVSAVSEPMILGGKQPVLGASVGIARYPEDAETPDALVACADRAMYAAKKGGKNAAVLFSPELGPAA
jgi:diguanylate cyclase (GGDEF)-like protein